MVGCSWMIDQLNWLSAYKYNRHSAGQSARLGLGGWVLQPLSSDATASASVAPAFILGGCWCRTGLPSAIWVDFSFHRWKWTLLMICPYLAGQSLLSTILSLSMKVFGWVPTPTLWNGTVPLDDHHPLPLKAHFIWAFPCNLAAAENALNVYFV